MGNVTNFQRQPLTQTAIKKRFSDYFLWHLHVDLFFFFFVFFSSTERVERDLPFLRVDGQYAVRTYGKRQTVNGRRHALVKNFATVCRTFSLFIRVYHIDYTGGGKVYRLICMQRPAQLVATRPQLTQNHSSHKTTAHTKTTAKKVF